jgi:DNA-3-methyladenine glycosylase I
VGDDPLMLAYHDEEWGRPLHDERALFELLTLEGAQAGLAWITILRKREGYRQAFAGFDPERVAAFDERDVERLIGDAGIVRHRGKIESAVSNARVLVAMHDDGTTLDDLAWAHAPSAPRRRPRRVADIPTTTPESTALSKALRARGFRFVGPTTVYAFMESAGIVDDHVAGCFRATG